MTSITYRGKIIHLLPQVYEPAEDSFLLVDALIDNIKDGDRVIELGCGSGIVSLFAQNRASLVVATDLNPYAVRCAGKNGINAIRTDLFDGINGQFDLIVFNPPYLPTSDEERLSGWDGLMLEGGKNGRQTIKRFIDGLGDYLSPKGRVLLLVSSLTGIKEVCNIMNNAGLFVEPISKSKHFFEQLVVLKGIRNK
ncbi:MAG: methyltransferase [Methanosarcinales archaeon]|nr:methyltransferase [Methanosarcinales archaeon]